MTLSLDQPDRWAERIIHRFPDDLQRQVRERWIHIANSGVRYPGIRHADGLAPSAKANQDLLAQWAAARAEHLHVAFDEGQIRERAARAAYLCMRLVRLELMQDHARSLGIEPPQIDDRITREGAIRRLCSEHWWRRQMRKAYTRAAESHLRALGVVHRRRQVYASDRAVAHRRSRNLRTRALLQELQAVSDAGDQLNLWDIVQKSQANPALRRAELMTRLRGFEEVAQAAGHVAEFITLTCPSAYHRTHADGTPNERWGGFSPRDGQRWLCRMWARARAKLARLSVMVYGFRVAEPHHDGTPHWHLVIFVKEALAELLRTVLAGFWLSEYSDEPGARKHRVRFLRIDPHKGSACGYLAKYVAKNIDGHEVGDDFEAEGERAEDTCHRVAAWASAHGIRQFQQIGGPSVCVWRELRRIRDRLNGLPTIEAARAAADAGQWSDFIAALGGIERGRDGDVRLWSERTGELSVYGELRGPQVVGVEGYMREGGVSVVKATGDSRLATEESRADVPAPPVIPTSEQGAQCRGANTGIVRVRTRCKVWRIQWKAPAKAGCSPVPSLGPVSITVRGSKTMPGEGSTGAHRSGSTRGSPWLH